MIRKLVFLILLFTFMLSFTVGISEKVSSSEQPPYNSVTERKVSYAPSSADIFMDSIDDIMKEELVRSVISEDEEALMARMIWGEDRENPYYQRAAVIWVVFNRMDAWGYRIENIVNEKQFGGYHPGNPVKPWAVDLVRDVTIRYVLEQNGFTDVGRTLPKAYLYFENIPPRRDHIFKIKERLSDKTNTTWDWSLPSPYYQDKD